MIYFGGVLQFSCIVHLCMKPLHRPVAFVKDFFYTFLYIHAHVSNYMYSIFQPITYPDSEDVPLYFQACDEKQVISKAIDNLWQTYQPQ